MKNLNIAGFVGMAIGGVVFQELGWAYGFPAVIALVVANILDLTDKGKAESFYNWIGTPLITAAVAQAIGVGYIAMKPEKFQYALGFDVVFLLVLVSCTTWFLIQPNKKSTGLVMALGIGSVIFMLMNHRGVTATFVLPKIIPYVVATVSSLLRLVELGKASSSTEIITERSISQSYNSSVLMLAISEYKVEKAIQIMTSDSDLIAFQDKFGNTALHVAVQLRSLDVLRKLVELGSDVNVKNSYNYSPLEWAKKNKWNACVEVLESSPTFHQEIEVTETTTTQEPSTILVQTASGESLEAKTSVEPSKLADVPIKLRELQSLLRDNVITEDEFQEKKKALLATY